MIFKYLYKIYLSVLHYTYYFIIKKGYQLNDNLIFNCQKEPNLFNTI